MRFFFKALFPALLYAQTVPAASWNGWTMERYTAETPHFRIYYHKGIEHLVKPVGDKFEQLYDIYQKTYAFRLPGKTEVLLQDGDESNGLTYTNLNFIILWTHDFDFNLRGSHEWWNDVITHEFGHLVSIWNSLKYPAWIEGIQFGYFTHPNEMRRLELFHVLPPDILPPWFAEGIAQFESSRHGADSWDTHRDMIMRALTLSDRLLTWDHLQSYGGKGDEYEKVYNHGFSLVTYIAGKYGFDKIVAMARRSAGVARLDFDGVIRSVLGIPGRQLYDEWKLSLKKKYSLQQTGLGKEVSGRKINKYGYENYWPRFAPDGKKIFFLSNGRQDYGFKILFSYALKDSLKEDERIKPEMTVSGFYDIHRPSGRISYCNSKSPQSELPADRGGMRTLDLYIDTLPPEKQPFRLFPKATERQITFKQGIFSAAFSPSGDKLVAAQRVFDRFRLAIVDTAGKSCKALYPSLDSSSQNIHFIYSVAWSPDGRTIAFSYFDKDNRKIGLYDTVTHCGTQLCSGLSDERDPAFSPDGKELYFSSDRTGIFNLYRLSFDTHRLSRITNVLGGAFAPAVSPDGKKIAYAEYDSAGYGIRLLDTIKSLADTAVDSLFRPREPVAGEAVSAINLPTHVPYSKIPRQFLLRPTLFVEQLNTKENNVYSGASAFKAGVVLNLMDAYSWLGMGTELGAMFLLEPTKIYKFLNLDHGIIDISQSYDAAAFGSTQVLPLTLSLDYSLRGIAGQDVFYDETEQAPLSLPYNIRLHNFNFLISHYLEGQGGGMGMFDDQTALHLLAGFNRYDVSMDLGAGNGGVFFYNVAKEYRFGAMTTLMGRAVDSRSSISPRGLAAKFQYNFWRLFSLKETNSFKQENGLLVENQNAYLYHEGIAHVMTGISAPWYGKHDIHFDLRGDCIKIARQDTVFPSFYQPIAWVPGYTYYFRSKRQLQTNEKIDTIPSDTVLVTGTAVVSGGLSYRFPLSRPNIDKKFWIFYLEKLYGCLNASGGIGVDRPSRILDFKRKDWLLSYGAEMRLLGSVFSGMPLAVSLRWDRGFDLPAPYGGNRFAMQIGFDFDNWGTILLPDYRSPVVGK